MTSESLIDGKNLKCLFKDMLLSYLETSLSGVGDTLASGFYSREPLSYIFCFIKNRIIG